MNMRFGLDGNEPYTQKQLADKMGISQSYISRIEKRMIAKLSALVAAMTDSYR